MGFECYDLEGGVRFEREVEGDFKVPSVLFQPTLHHDFLIAQVGVVLVVFSSSCNSYRSSSYTSGSSSINCSISSSRGSSSFSGSRRSSSKSSKSINSIRS